MATGTTNRFAGKASNKSGGGDFDKIEAGSYVAHMIALIDLGTHDDEFKGKLRPDQRTFAVAFELSGESGIGGHPPVIAQTYSMYEKDGEFVYGAKNPMRKLLQSLRGRDYQEGEIIDPSGPLGRPCMVNVQYKTTGSGKEIAIVGSVSAVPKGMSIPSRHFDPIAFHISDLHPPDLSHLPYVYGGSPKGMQPIEDIIAQSKERRGLPIGGQGNTPYSESAAEGLPAFVPASDDDLPDF